MLETQKVATSEFSVGMFFSGLDRPWLETPFITQGFVIESADDISRLQTDCEYVQVDFRRSQKVGLQNRRVLRKQTGKQGSKKLNPDRPRVPLDEIKFFYHSRDQDFQAELVETFIQAVGIYPAGTLVELSSGEAGVVVAEYRTRRLRPKVLLLLDNKKNRIPQPHVIDLHDDGTGDSNNALHITQSLEPPAYGIDLTQVAEVA
ncbi:DUF3391 domain-containing protein [Candidatus Marimicrobium litorale]|uniref:HD-GYP domain-containing protein n=1 Tax=Candidatus Marimicrobium litorale TaxID=2518991 RepID=A0ABT3T4Z6_9GAMM|nr:DUF3391 domain-containing protein [Candidatus Marimicrobium litorale]MCX2976895.1 HD-GYP domain-containing protein [Candidatus Marimicrobium litorale]